MYNIYYDQVLDNIRPPYVAVQTINKLLLIIYYSVYTVTNPTTKVTLLKPVCIPRSFLHQSQLHIVAHVNFYISVRKNGAGAKIPQQIFHLKEVGGHIFKVGVISRIYIRGEKNNAHFSICEVVKVFYEDLLDDVQICDQHHGSLCVPIVVP